MCVNHLGSVQPSVQFSIQFRLRNMESDFEVLVLISTNFKLSWKPPKCKLEVIAWWNEQNHIVCKKQRFWGYWIRKYPLWKFCCQLSLEFCWSSARDGSWQSLSDTRVLRAYGYGSVNMITKLLIDLWPRVLHAFMDTLVFKHSVCLYFELYFFFFFCG